MAEHGSDPTEEQYRLTEDVLSRLERHTDPTARNLRLSTRSSSSGAGRMLRLRPDGPALLRYSRGRRGLRWGTPSPGSGPRRQLTARPFRPTDWSQANWNS